MFSETVVVDQSALRRVAAHSAFISDLVDRANAANRARVAAGHHSCGFLVAAVCAVAAHPEGASSEKVARVVGATRPGMYKTLATAVEAGLLERVGSGRHTVYRLRTE